MKGTFIETQNVKDFRQAVETLCDIAGVQAGMGVVYGPANTGKTECARNYVAQSDGLYISVGEGMTAAGMLSALCAELGKPGMRLIVKCKKYLISELETKPRPIFVDNVDRFKDICDMVEDLRDVHDLTGSPVILIGRPELLERLRISRRTWNRVVLTVEFKPVSFG